MQAKLINTFDHLNEADFLAKAGTIVSNLTANANYPEPWAVQVSTLAQFTTSYTRRIWTTIMPPSAMTTLK